VDPLEKSDLDLDRNASPAEKLRQALEMMASGLELQRANLRRQNPHLSEAELAQAFHRWLFSDDDA